MTFLYKFLNILLPRSAKDEIIGDFYELEEFFVKKEYSKWKSLVIIFKLGVKSALILRWDEFQSKLEILADITCLKLENMADHSCKVIESITRPLEKLFIDFSKKTIRLVQNPKIIFSLTICMILLYPFIEKPNSCNIFGVENNCLFNNSLNWNKFSIVYQLNWSEFNAIHPPQYWSLNSTRTKIYGKKNY